MIALYTKYLCLSCSETFSDSYGTFALCPSCESENVQFDGMSLMEVVPRGKRYAPIEVWTESTGTPVCDFCSDQDMECADPIKAGWLAQAPVSRDMFSFMSACQKCRKVRGLISITREILRERTGGQFAQAEQLENIYLAEQMARRGSEGAEVYTFSSLEELEKMLSEMDEKE